MMAEISFKLQKEESYVCLWKGAYNTGKAEC